MEQKSVNKTNSNSYTFIFAIVMVIVVGTVLAFTATSLQPIQAENVRQEKMQSILATIGIETDRAGAEALYNQYIVETVALREDGTEDESANAFEVDLAKELKKPTSDQIFPLYKADVDGETFYIIPLRGNGLWNAIFGYISLKDDVNTVMGATFDHLGETPGLGAEITKEWFKESFAGEQVYDENGSLVGISVVKGYSGDAKDDNQVNSISGATITADGVSEMISERLQHYKIYFEKEKEVKVANN